MFARKITLFMLFIFTLLSGITWTSSEAGAGISGRLIIADFVGLAILLIFFVFLYVKKHFHWNNIFTIFVLFLFFNLFSLVISSFPEKGIIEYLTHLFIFLVGISIYNLILYQKPDLTYLSDIIQSVMLASGLIALVGLLQFFLFPTLFSNSFGGLSGTFRNTGQAGAYFSIFICLGIAGITSGLFKKSPLNLSIIFFLFLALIFTFKRAALIGISVGLLLLLIKFIVSSNVRDKKYAIYFVSSFLVFGFLILNLFLWAGDNIEGVIWRSSSKFNSDTAEDFVEGFLAENIDATLRAFWDKPLLGVGMGNMAGIYTEKYEIHSTYMAVLSASGLVGFFIYIVYMFNILKKVFAKYRVAEVSDFLFNLGVLYIGLMISWSYTYHLRKREFWILLIIILLVMAYGKITNKLSRNSNLI